MFSRVVLVLEVGEDASRIASLVKWLAPALQEVVVLGHLTRPWQHWLLPGPWDVISQEISQGEELLQGLREQLAFVPGQVRLEIVHELSAEIVAETATSCDAQAILMGPLAWTTTPLISRWLEALLKQLELPVVWLGEAMPKATPLAVMLGAHWHASEDSRSFVSFLQDQPRSFQKVIVLDWNAPTETPDELYETWRSLIGLEAILEVHRGTVGLAEAAERLKAEVQRLGADLMVLGADDAMGSWSLPFLSRDILRSFGCPVVLLPSRAPLVEEPLEVADCLWHGEDHITLHLRPPPRLLGVPEKPGEVLVLVDGAHRAMLSVARSWVRMPLLPEERQQPPEVIGLLRASIDVAVTPDTIEAYARVLQPGQRHLILFDPTMDMADLELLKELHIASPERLFVAVALQPAISLTQLRRQLGEAGLAACHLLDASQLLDDGGASDLPDDLMGLKLSRVALRLRARGLQVIAIAGRALLSTEDQGFAVLQSAREHPDVLSLQGQITASYAVAPAPATTLSAQLERLTFAPAVDGNEIQLDLDNRIARQRLLQHCREAIHHIHVQCYIVKDDPLTQAVEQALIEAAKRGVQVRILLDSLYSMHGSFGQVNPWVERMQENDGIEVLCFRPIDDLLPSLEQLKQRNHRKILLFDGLSGVVTGRNLAAPYYTSFDEVIITPETPGQSLPWADAGVWIKGRILGTLEASFLRDWEAAGGERFGLPVAQDAGQVRCRFVRHDGLVDANTLEAQLALIRFAQRHLYVVNTFPLQHEVRHALRQAIERGVQVRLLVGHVRPLYGEGREPFPGGILRELATAVIHGRVDRLVDCGGEAFEYLIDNHADWPVEMLPVRPHVHSKLITCDGEYTAIGSANLDVTGGFWESEGLLIIEDQALTQALEAELLAMMRPAGKIDPEDADWRQRAQRRAWISESWPNILS